MPKVLCIGDVMLDVVVALQAPINYGEDTPSKITTHGGGAAGNVASWITRTGAGASIVARVGNDSAGAALISEFDDLGVDHSTLSKLMMQPVLWSSWLIKKQSALCFPKPVQTRD
jgi:sugar/nucleoside kinase (ribokinase family)